MKNLILIGGSMGVGKTTTSRLLQSQLPSCAFLDGDWCWDMRPFVVTDETRAMVTGNICHVLNSFLRCSIFENIIFCWVMHEQGIIDDLLARLDTAGWQVHTFSLVCSAEALRRRLQADVHAGVRTPDVIERSLARLPLYSQLHTAKLDVSAITAAQAADAIKKAVLSAAASAEQ